MGGRGLLPQLRQRFGLLQVRVDKPTPLLFFSRRRVADVTKQPSTTRGLYLASGFSVVAINYRHISHAEGRQVVPPVRRHWTRRARLAFRALKAAE